MQVSVASVTPVVHHALEELVNHGGHGEHGEHRVHNLRDLRDLRVQMLLKSY